MISADFSARFDANEGRGSDAIIIEVEENELHSDLLGKSTPQIKDSPSLNFDSKEWVKLKQLDDEAAVYADGKSMFDNRKSSDTI